MNPIPKPEHEYTRLGIYCHAKGTFHELVPIEKALDVDTMYLVEKDNLIVNITFAWEHAIAITSNSDEGKVVSHRFPTYAFINENSASFYKYLILKPRFKYELGVASPGGAGRNRVLNKNAFLEIPINVPSLEEQNKIAAFMQMVDKRIEKQEALIAALKKYKRGVIQSIFDDETKDLFGEKSLGKRVRLSELMNFQNGINADASKYGKGIRYISVSDILKNNYITYDKIVGQVDIDNKTLETYSVTYGDVLFQRSSETREDAGRSNVYLDNEKTATFGGFVIRGKI